MSSFVPPPTGIARPVQIEPDGVLGMLADGAIINAGGVAGSTFTVGGRGLLFDDGTSTAGGGGSSGTLQSIYDASPAAGGATTVLLSPNKNLVFQAGSSGNYFSIGATDGQVTINGNLVVMGTSTTINSVTETSNNVLVQPSLPTTVPFSIIPTIGTSMLVDLLQVKSTFSGAPVLRVDNAGNLIATQNLTVGGLINGVNIAALNAEVQAHINGTGYFHQATAIQITPITDLPGATNVQQALNALDTKINNVSGGGATSTVFGFSYIQATPSNSWTITHNGNTIRAQVSIYDNLLELIIPQSVQIIDANNIIVTFLSPLAGRATVLLF